MSQDAPEEPKFKQALPYINKKLEEMQHADLIKWIGWLFAGAVAAIVCVFVFYLAVFGAFSFNNKQDVWGQFGDYVGGILNPVFAFLTMLALALSIILQSRQNALSAKQLELSSNELKLTREQLERSAKAQELSEKALRAQATSAERTSELTAINYLINYRKSEIEKIEINIIKEEMMRGGDAVARDLAEHDKAIAGLTSRISQMFEEITVEARMK